MNFNTTIDRETQSLQEVLPGTQSQAADCAGVIERWLHEHLTMVALAVTAGGFLARIVTAGRSYFNPDEALHYFLFNQSSLLLAYKASLTNAHPPLIYVLLYFWRFLGRSELVLRLPLVFAGTAFCWVTFKWIEALFGRPAGLIGVIAVAFSPDLVALSAEVREYALLLFCVTAALYFLEKAFEQRSARTMWVFSLFLYLAILSHYSAAFFVLGAGIYALARVADSECPREVVCAWVGGQAGALVIYLFLYVTHIAKIKNNLAIWATTFGGTFFRFNEESIFHFTRENTWNIFNYLFAQRYVAGAMLTAFIVAIAILVFRDFMSTPRNRGSRHVGIHLLLPFVAIWAAAIGGIYPYIGSRHTTVLAPFAIAAVSFLLAAICRQKLWAGLLVASLLAGVSNCYGRPLEPGITKADQSRELMKDAMNYMQESISEGDVILADMQSSLPLAYYYCGADDAFLTRWSRVSFDQFSCHGHLIVSLHFWLLRPEGLSVTFDKMVHNYGLKPGDRVWVFQAGWGGDLIAQLPRQIEEFHCVTPRAFGQNITIVPLMVGPDFTPVPQAKCQN
jgi:hypothetical protein